MMRINVINFLRRSVHYRDKPRNWSRAICTSVDCRNKYSNENVNYTLNQKYIDSFKTDYENTFGNIENFEQKFAKIQDDPEDILEYERAKQAKGKTMKQYIDEIKTHLDNHDYKSALNILEIDMVNDKKRLNPFVYKVLICYNAKAGNLKEAYRLFVNYKRRQGFVSGAMYTAMFNACANCSNSFLAIEKADAVAESMRNNKRHSINTTNYNAMLKAYGRHGDVPKCLKIMDEVLERRDKVRCETYNFLLQACISDKNSGLRHALVVWRKMIQNLVNPSIFTFNLMLRCVKECSLGDVLLIPDMVKYIKEESGKYFKKKVIMKTINSKTKRKVMKIPVNKEESTVVLVDNRETQSSEKKMDFIDVQIESNESSQLALAEKPETSESSSELPQTQSNNSKNESSYLQLNKIESYKSNENSVACSENLEEYASIPSVNDHLLNESQIPNLISETPTTGAVIGFGGMTKPSDRFMLLGGMKGFLKTMTEFNVKPNIKTFTQMLDVIPSNLEAEEELLSLVNEYNVKLDATFFNVLIKRRFFRHEDSSAKDCLEKMNALKIKPDLITFGVLALGCRTSEQGMELLKTLQEHGFRANTEILETLLTVAHHARDMNYVLAILQKAKEEGTELSQSFVAKLGKSIKVERLRRKKEAEKRSEEPEESSVSVQAS